ncbi:hypothetical protein [Nitratidesulfovibrio vulgaris]|uniref:hypothetical protein n=1 Tax=Nitratidesulfovibrio vulgaris TaxID=881 RepID=UPI001231D39F|nr:hypothetical protein [Nitratidesulfovibrio vulgaris]
MADTRKPGHASSHEAPEGHRPEASQVTLKVSPDASRGDPGRGRPGGEDVRPGRDGGGTTKGDDARKRGPARRARITVFQADVAPAARSQGRKRQTLREGVPSAARPEGLKLHRPPVATP